MINNLKSNYKKYLPWLIFLALFIVLALKVINLRLLLDDNDHIFTPLIGNYVEHFTETMDKYGFWRPLGFIFLYFIYTFYLISPILSHLLVLIIHFASGLVIKKIFANKLGESKSLLISLIYIAFPFFTEQYGWLASSNATIANLALLSQIYIAISDQIDRKKKMIAIAALQFIGMLFYESIFFTFIPLSLLLVKIHPRDESQTKKHLGGVYANLKDLIILSIPSATYFLLRNVIFVPHNSATIRDLRLPDFLSGKFVSVIINNVVKLFNDMSFLFLGRGSFDLFWKHNLVEGLKNMMQSPVSILAINYLVLLIVKYLIDKNKNSDSFQDDKNTILKPNFWMQMAFFSLLPSLLLIQPNFPFRVIVLPVFFTATALILVLDKKFAKYTIIFMMSIFIFCLANSVQMLHEMTELAKEDESLVNQTVEILDSRIEDGQKAEIVYRNMPYSTRTDFNYGEYLLSCTTYDWCMYPALSRRTDKFSSIVVNPGENFVPQEISVSLIYDPADHKLNPE